MSEELINTESADDGDTKIDAICCLLLVVISVAAAIFWVSGQ